MSTKDNSETTVSSTSAGVMDELAPSMANNRQRRPSIAYRKSSLIKLDAAAAVDEGDDDNNNAEEENDTSLEEWVDQVLGEFQQESVFCLENEPRPLPYFEKKGTLNKTIFARNFIFPYRISLQRHGRFSTLLNQR